MLLSPQFPLVFASLYTERLHGEVWLRDFTWSFVIIIQKKQVEQMCFCRQLTEDGRSGVCGDPVHFHAGVECKIDLEPAIILHLRSAAVIVLGRMCKPDIARKIHVQVTPHSQE